MITQLFLKGRLANAIGNQERAALEDAVHDVITLEPRKRLVKRGELVNQSYYLMDGFMVRYIDDKRGRRQSVGIQVAGDWVDLHSFPMKRLDHDVCTLGWTKIAVFEHQRLARLISEQPRLARIMWFSTLLDAAMHREWVFRLGRLNAEGRIAHLICELAERLSFVDRFDGTFLDVPMTQQDFAEACGISDIHANRTFRIMRESGLIANEEGRAGLTIVDHNALMKLGEYKGDYLYGSGELAIDEPYPPHGN